MQAKNGASKPAEQSLPVHEKGTTSFIFLFFQWDWWAESFHPFGINVFGSFY